jgi:preprotein translocase subunit SecE
MHQKEHFVAKDEKKKEEKNFLRKILDSIERYFKETIGELRKVSWPTRKEALSLTAIVLVVLFIMSMYLGLLDFIFTRIFTLIFA